MNKTKGLLEQLTEGPVICAEGYLFELERRGYLSAGAYVPEVVLEHQARVRPAGQPINQALSRATRLLLETVHRKNTGRQNKTRCRPQKAQ